ncbi:hypothetical protein DPMN_083070 [Dreissena polymorpha]|uniref:Uncharacterized protein n=1 Tax=Dreissena polymorpha TaxID=45954 RepID=A0A9D3Y848_DREPO|nr:hypothetical protein DPMN_083070 [Dreissena polymorpha]
MARQRPTRLVMGPCIVEIDRIVIRDVQYKFEVIRCRNEEVNFQGSSAYSVGGDKHHIMGANARLRSADGMKLPINFNLRQYFIGTNVLIKFHEDWPINKTALPPGDNVFQQTRTNFKLDNDIIRFLY